MNGQPIPGFYYDPDKKKYFQIQSAAASRDLSHNLAHSAHNQRRRERVAQRHDTAAASLAKTRAQRVVRRRHATTAASSSSTTTTRLTNACIDRELGRDSRAVHVHRLWPSACLAGVVAQPEWAEDPPADANIRLFALDALSQTVYAVHGDNVIKRRLGHGHSQSHSHSHSHTYARQPWDELGRATSTVSSLNFLPATGALAVTTFGSDRPPVVQLSDPATDGPYVSQQFTPKDCSTIWAAAARPTTFDPGPGLRHSVAASHVEHLAVAASASVLLFTRSQTGAWDSHVAVTGQDADIYSLDWLSYTTLALGLRNGKIAFHDTRSGGTSHVLTHPNLVANLRRADDPTRLLCSGLNDSLVLYDIRHSHTHSTQSRRRPNLDTHYNQTYFSTLPTARPLRGKKRRKLDRVVAQNWSEPVHAFSHSNRDDPELALDVHARLGLVAAAQDSETDVAIRVSNLWTGEVVREYARDGDGGKRAWDGRARPAESIRSIEFVDDDETSGGVEIWAGWKGGIARFAW